MPRLLTLLWHVLALFGVGVVAAAVWFAAQGVGATREPSAFEKRVARTARHLAIPSAALARQNPEPESPEASDDARAHWADHCATCHGADGRGQTEMGRGLYPRAPDMTGPDTRALSDGELFYIIENGVKLTGMPGWGDGTPDGARASWRLVHLVRRLPSLTDDEIAEIEARMPLSPVEWQQREDERRFLEGAASPQTPLPHVHPPGRP